MSMNNQVAVITGGAQGLGKGFAESLLKRGTKVCIADVQVKTGEATVSSFNQAYGNGKAYFVQCDVTREADVKGLFDRVRQRYGRLDILVNNAGISGEKHWDKMVDINLKGVIMCTRYAQELMQRDKGGNGGTIVNIASTAALVPIFTGPVYAATKEAVMAYTRSLACNPYARELGVNYVCLCPSFANTEILKSERLYVKESDEMLQRVGIMEVDQVVAAFLELLDLPENNGIVMAVTKRKGIKIVRRLSRM